MALIEDILDSAGAKTIKSASKEDEITVCCPFCIERDQSEDSRFRLGINTATGYAHCFNCDWSSRNLIRTARELCRIFDLELNLAGGLITRIVTEKKKIATKPEPIEWPLWYERFYPCSRDEIMLQALAYLEQRGVTHEQIRCHRVGFASTGRYSYRVLFPVLGMGRKLYGFVGRDFTGHQKPKYLNTPGIKLLWNAHKPTRYAVIVEGVMDALQVELAIKERHLPEITAVARLGSAITDLQLKQLKQFGEVAILPDWDKPGVEGAANLARRCQQNNIKCAVAVPDVLNGSDPGSMQADLILIQIKNAKPWSDATAFRLRTIREELC